MFAPRSARRIGLAVLTAAIVSLPGAAVAAPPPDDPNNPWCTLFHINCPE